MAKRTASGRKANSSVARMSEVREHLRLEVVGARGATMTAILALEQNHGRVMHDVALSLRRHILDILDRNLQAASAGKEVQS